MEGIRSYTHCLGCKGNTELGVEWHCSLCHATYPKATQHTCKVLTEAVAEPEPSTIPDRFKNARFVFGSESAPAEVVMPSRAPRSPWPAKTYRHFEIPKE